jgi:hypothetical protein
MSERSKIHLHDDRAPAPEQRRKRVRTDVGQLPASETCAKNFRGVNAITGGANQLLLFV